MKQARSIYDSYLRDLREHHPQEEPIMHAAIEAFDSIQAGNLATECLLSQIVLAVSDSRKRLFEIAVDFLDKLTEKYIEACEAVTRMAVDTRHHVRFNAIMCIGKAAPLDFKLKLLRQGLLDKSAKVRQKSADWALRQAIREIIPELEKAALIEKDAKALATSVYALKMLRDGYIVEHLSDGTVAVNTFEGGTRWFEKTEFESKGIEAIIAEFDND